MTKVTLRYYFKYDNYHNKTTFLSVNTVCDKSHREKRMVLKIIKKHKKNHPVIRMVLICNFNYY
jgi:hypothetical protein